MRLRAALWSPAAALQPTVLLMPCMPAASKAGSVTVLTEEAHLPYDRVALSKALTDSDC